MLGPEVSVLPAEYDEDAEPVGLLLLPLPLVQQHHQNQSEYLVDNYSVVLSFLPGVSKRGGGGCMGRCLKMQMLHPAQCNTLC